jgi:hypothetical protein
MALATEQRVAHTRTMPDKRLKRPRDPAQLAKLMFDIASGEVEDRPPTPEEQGKDPAAVSLGRRGSPEKIAPASSTCFVRAIPSVP